MATDKSRKITKKNESLVEDPHELLLSLVDMGSLDVEDALLACVSEMSDAECKRVLNSLSLPECCDEVEDEEPVEEPEEAEYPADEEEPEEEPAEELDLSKPEEPEEDEEIEAELEARIRRLERCLRTESMNRDRTRSKLYRHGVRHK